LAAAGSCAAAERKFEIETRTTQAMNPARIQGGSSFKNIRKCYQPQFGHWALSSFSAKIAPIIGEFSAADLENDPH
jgi:hypothetical protein